MKLTVPDVYGKDARGAALQQHLREAAGRGTDVEGDNLRAEKRKCSSAAISLRTAAET
jgi:hypothetical protein